MSKFNTARKEKPDLYNQFPTAYITKVVKSHFPNVTAGLSLLSLIKPWHMQAVSLTLGRVLRWLRFKAGLEQTDRWAVSGLSPVSTTASLSISCRQPVCGPLAVPQSRLGEWRTALCHVITFIYRKKTFSPAKRNPAGRKRRFSLPVWREEKSKMNFAMWTECWIRQTCSWRAIVSELAPWHNSDRVTADRMTDQIGEVWLRLCRRSVALPETGFKAAFLLSNTGDFSTKSLCPFCK